MQTWWAAGRLLFEVGRKSEALDFFRSARERCGQHDHALRIRMCLEIARVYRSVRDSEAERYLREIEKDLPHAAFALPGMREWVLGSVANLRGDKVVGASHIKLANSQGLPYPFRAIGY